MKIDCDIDFNKCKMTCLYTKRIDPKVRNLTNDYNKNNLRILVDDTHQKIAKGSMNT